LGVKLIDQHALHERILFETLMERARSGRTVAGQGLLLPEMLELTPVQAAAFGDEAAREVLASLGYEVSEFGPRAVAVHAVPHVLKNARAAELLREVLEAIAAVSEDHPAGKGAPDRARLYERAAYVLSCKGAIKAGERLNLAQGTALLEEYVRKVGAASFTCPHGRPLAVELGWEEIERRVGRG
jgi:DNA mismatch repair protein MutL